MVNSFSFYSFFFFFFFFFSHSYCLTRAEFTCKLSGRLQLTWAVAVSSSSSSSFHPVSWWSDDKYHLNTGSCCYVSNTSFLSIRICVHEFCFFVVVSSFTFYPSFLCSLFFLTKRPFAQGAALSEWEKRQEEQKYSDGLRERKKSEQQEEEASLLQWTLIQLMVLPVRLWRSGE